MFQQVTIMGYSNAFGGKSLVQEVLSHVHFGLQKSSKQIIIKGCFHPKYLNTLLDAC